MMTITTRKTIVALLPFALFCLLALVLCPQRAAAQCQSQVQLTGTIPTDCGESWTLGDWTLSTRGNEECSPNACNFQSGSNFIRLQAGALEVDLGEELLLTGYRIQLNHIGSAANGTNCTFINFSDGNGATRRREATAGTSSISEYDVYFPANRLVISSDNREIYAITLLYQCSDGQAPTADGCITFDAQSPGGLFTRNVGETLLFENNVPVTAAPFASIPTGTNDTTIINQGNYQFIEGPNWNIGEATSLWTTFGAAKFDFGQLPQPPIQVSFDFFDGAYGSNLSVNGQPVYIGDLSQVPSDQFAGVTVTQLGQLGNTLGYRILLEGSIESLTVGGLEFALDNVCFNYDAYPATCLDLHYDNGPLTITNSFDSIPQFIIQTPGITIRPRLWQSANGFPSQGNALVWGNPGDNDYFRLDTINLDFDLSPSGEVYNQIRFTLWPGCCASGINLGINDGPIYYYETLDQIPSQLPDGTQVEVQIDQSDPQATRYHYTLSGQDFSGFEVGAYFALLSDICYEYQESASQVDCVDFAPVAGGVSFGELYGQDPGFLVPTVDQSVPVTLETFYFNNGATAFDRLAYSNNGIEGLNKFLVDMNLKFDLSQVPGTVHTFKFRGFFGSYFNFAVNGEAPVYVGGPNALPVTLPSGATVSSEAIPGSQHGFIITITGVDMEEVLFGGHELYFGEVCYQYEPDPACEISSLFAQVNCASDELTVRFGYDQATSDSFELYLNNSVYQNYALADLPLTLDIPPGTVVNSVQACILGNPDCCAITDVLPCPPDCSIGDLIVDPAQCTGPNQYSLVLDFDYANPTADFFDVFGNNGELIGTYALSDLPLTINDFPGSGTGSDAIVVCIQGSSSCCNQWGFQAPDCTPDCAITDVAVEVLDCTPNGIFYFQLDLNVDNPASDSFLFYGSDGLFGAFAYDDLPVNVGPLDGDGSLYGFEVIDASDTSCGTGFTFQAPTCSVGCSVGDLVIDIGQCTGLDQYVLYLDFDTQNPTADWFDLFAGNGDLVGTYALSDLPLTIDNFPSSGTGSDAILVCIQGSNACCNELVFQAPDCTPDCAITDVAIEVLDCTPNGIFFFQLDLTVNNPASDSFFFYGSDGLFGAFAYDDLPVNVGPINGDGSLYGFEVVDASNSSCGTGFTFQAPSCSVGCSVGDLVIDTGPCTGFNQYVLYLDFDVQNPTADLFDVFATNGDLVGSYPLSDLPLTIENFPSSGTGSDAILVCIQGSNACCNELVFQAPDCTLDCSIEQLWAAPQDCTPNGIFFVDIDFIPNGPPSDSFIVSGNGMVYGTFAYNDLPVAVGPFVGDGSSVYGFEVRDSQNPDCVTFTEILAPDCSSSGACEIQGVTATPSTCDADGFYYVEIDFMVTNPGGAGFMVVGDGVFYGNFSYADLPIQLGPFQGDNNQDLQFNIFDIATPFCIGLAEVDPVDCSPCILTDMTLIPTDCDNGQFWVQVDFDAQNVSSDQFRLEVDNAVYGSFPYLELPLTVGPFPGDGNAVLVFSATDLADPQCSLANEVEAPDCVANCAITNLGVENLGCNGAGQFTVLLDLNVADPASDVFKVVGNGVNYGNFDYADLPVQIGPLDGDGQTVWTFTAFDAFDPDCSATYELGTVSCNTGPCAINDIEIVDLSCDTNDSYTFFLDFTVDNPTSDSFFINAGSNGTSTYALSDLPVLVNDFDIQNGNVQTLRVCLPNNGGIACCLSLDFQGPDCTTDCALDNLSANWMGCNPNGTSEVWLNFDASNTTNPFFEVRYEGELVGTFPTAELPLLLPNFPTVDNNQNVAEIEVCLQNQNVCCSTDFDILNCIPGNCIDFEAFSSDDIRRVGQEIVPGTLLASTSTGVDLRIAECYPPANTNVIDIFEGTTTCGAFSNTGRYLFVQGAGISLDFSAFDTLPQQISFDFCGEGYVFFDDTGQSFDYAHYDADSTVVVGPNLTMTIRPRAPGDNGGEVWIEGEVERLSICGVETYLDNICFDGVPANENDNGCVEIEALEDGQQYTQNTGDSLLLESEGVALSLRNPNTIVWATSTPLWTNFNAADGLHLFLTGSLGIDFSPLSNPVQFVSLDFSGGVGNSITVNGGVAFEFDFQTPDTVLIIAPGVTLFFNRDATNTVEGNISLFGETEEIVLDGAELAIDNICYYTALAVAQVWPGDANADNIANHVDLLNLGLAFGTRGAPRIDGSTNWEGLEAEDWNRFFADGLTNFKHADCNGDGIVDELDLEVLEANYGLERGPVPPIVTLPGSPSDPPFFADLAGMGTMRPGQAVTVPIEMGSFEFPVNGIYGIAFSVEYDPDLFAANSVDIEVNESWFGTPGQDLLSIDQQHTTPGRIEVAISRIDGVEAVGFGTIAEFIGVIDDIVAKQIITTIRLVDIRAIDASEGDVVFYVPESPGVISTDLEEQQDLDGLLLYPVPATEWLNIHNYNREEINTITVYNALGQQMDFQRFPQRRTGVDVSTWPSGIYYIDIKFPDAIVTRMFKVTRL